MNNRKRRTGKSRNHSEQKYQSKVPGNLLKGKKSTFENGRVDGQNDRTDETLFDKNDGKRE